MCRLAHTTQEDVRSNADAGEARLAAPSARARTQLDVAGGTPAVRPPRAPRVATALCDAGDAADAATTFSTLKPPTSMPPSPSDGRGGDSTSALPDIEADACHLRAFRCGLYLGNCTVAADKQWLQARGVTHVVNLARELPSCFPDAFTYLRLELRDDCDADLRGALHATLDFIDAALAAGGGVLVHCRAGKSRSATVVIAYGMLCCGWQLDAAWAVVRDARHGLALNVGFQTLLRHLQEERDGTLGARKTRRTAARLM
jgi:hypothetical protein